MELDRPNLRRPTPNFCLLVRIVVAAHSDEALFRSRFFPSPAECPGIPKMSLSCRYAAQRCARQLRPSTSLRASSSVFRQRIARRCNSTEAAVNPKIDGIVSQISQLTLLETADLVASLKVR